MAAAAYLAVPGSAKASAPRPISRSVPRTSTDSSTSYFSSHNTPTESYVRNAGSLRGASWSRGESLSRRSQGSSQPTNALPAQIAERTTGFDLPAPSRAAPDEAFRKRTSAVGLLQRQLSTPADCPVARLKARLQSDLSNEHVSTVRGSRAWLAARARCPVLLDPHVQRAYAIAAAAHDGQRRLDGSTVTEHCEQAAIALAGLGLDAATVSAALLHDVLDDSDMSEALLRELVTDEVAHLVTQVTKVSDVSQLFRSDASLRTPASIERLSSMFVALADVRVVLIKLADRLHNMRTLGALSEGARARMAHETAAVFVPLANRLGVWSIKAELEDLCLQHTEPQQFAALQDQVQRLQVAHSTALGGFLADTAALLHTQGVGALELNGRPKSLSAIYQKLQTPSASGGAQRGLDDVHDVLAIRVIVSSKVDCYRAMRAIEKRFHAQPGRTKDYIRTPKANGYQSLHSVVHTDDGTPIEVQIRTDKMHFIAEFGVASHWRYKESAGAGRRGARTGGAQGSGDGTEEGSGREAEGEDGGGVEAGGRGGACEAQIVSWQRMWVAFGLKLCDTKLRPAGSAPREECLQSIGSGLLRAQPMPRRRASAPVDNSAAFDAAGSVEGLDGGGAALGAADPFADQRHAPYVRASADGGRPGAADAVASLAAQRDCVLTHAAAVLAARTTPHAARASAAADLLTPTPSSSDLAAAEAGALSAADAGAVPAGCAGGSSLPTRTFHAYMRGAVAPPTSALNVFFVAASPHPSGGSLVHESPAGTTVAGAAAGPSFPAGTRASSLLINGAPPREGVSQALCNGDIVSLCSSVVASGSAARDVLRADVHALTQDVRALTRASRSRNSDMRTQLTSIFRGILPSEPTPVPWRHAVH